MIAVFFFSAILYYTDRFILNLLVDPIRAELHINDTQVSLLQGVAFAVVYALAGLPFGRFADVLPRRGVIMAGVVTWSAATVACGFAHSFGQLFAARVAVGIGEAALAPAAVSMIADYFPPQRRGAAIGVFLTGMAIGGGMAIVAGGGLLQAANAGLFRRLPLMAGLAPWREVLVLLGLPAVVILALLLTIQEPARHGRAASGAALPLKDVVRGFASRAPVLLPLYLAVALASAGDFSLQNWTPALLSRRFHMGPGEIGSTLGAIAIAVGVVGSIFGGVLSDRLARRGGPRARLKASLTAALIGLGGAGIALAGSGYQAMGFFTLWLLMASFSETIGITLVQELVPNEMRGVGASLVSLFNMLIGLGLGTSLTAVFTDHVYRNPQAVGWSITSVMAPAGVLSVLLFWRALTALKRHGPA
ncbi:MAG: MFS transporter [Caulobacteraceae bacterium]|nr:MFS transporter [Caulobacteraceae bacterium]